MLDFTPIPTVTTTCGHEVSTFEGRWVVDGEEVASPYAMTPKLTGCPCPVECAADTIWKFEQRAELTV